MIGGSSEWMGTSNSMDCLTHFPENRPRPLRGNVADEFQSTAQHNGNNAGSDIRTDSQEISTLQHQSVEVQSRSPTENEQDTHQSEAVKKNSINSIWKASLVQSVLMIVAAMYISSQGHEESVHELRLMLVGKTGAGKSASGNTILDEDVFTVMASPTSVTGFCSKMNKIVNGMNITVIDTPGVLDTWLTPNNRAYSAPDCISDPTHRPHVFLLVIRLGRFTEEERHAVNWIQENFGELALSFTMILFTGGDMLEKRNIEEFVNESKELKDLVESCKGRYHVFNNNQKDDLTQVTGLLQKINLMMYESMGYTPSNEVYKKAQEKLALMVREEQYQNKYLKQKLEERCKWFGS